MYARQMRPPPSVSSPYCVFLCLLFPCLCVSMSNGVSLTPPLGWCSWERFRCNTDCVNDPDFCISEGLYMEMADILVSEGYRDAGYVYVNIDACWNLNIRDEKGNIQADPTLFPHGIPALAEYMHERGLKLGIYSGLCDPKSDKDATITNHYQQDADLLAQWGIDYFKLDAVCEHTNVTLLNEGYPLTSLALNKTGRPILFECSWPFYLIHDSPPQPVNWTAVSTHCNQWRITWDAQDMFDSVASTINYWYQQQDTLIPLSQPGGWNDPDYVMCGDFSLSYQECKVQLGMWSMWSAPIFLSNDLRALEDPRQRDLILNREVLAIQQDGLGEQARCIFNDADALQSIWLKHLSNADIAVALLNQGYTGTPSDMTVTWAQLGLNPNQQYQLRDVFDHVDLGARVRNFTGRVKIHSIQIIRMSIDKQAPIHTVV